jgi:hypothetical protein
VGDRLKDIGGQIWRHRWALLFIFPAAAMAAGVDSGASPAL